ncbi:hypothetical protein PG989_012122 [Apiospora arundinis]
MPLALTAIGKNQIVIAHISATTSIAKHLPFNIRMSSIPQFALLASLAYHWHRHVLDGAGKKGAHRHKWAQGHGQRMTGYELDDIVVEGRRRPINESEEDGSHKPETPAAPAEPAEPESLAPERDQYQ